MEGDSGVPAEIPGAGIARWTGRIIPKKGRAGKRQGRIPLLAPRQPAWAAGGRNDFRLEARHVYLQLNSPYKRNVFSL